MIPLVGSQLHGLPMILSDTNEFPSIFHLLNDTPALAIVEPYQLLRLDVIEYFWNCAPDNSSG
ncbi:MAG: hypothetical protein FDX21_07520 [Chlorobium sp.]|nr:MAG: hypothetical protein FDX21_07520 [Chlorobium sp.]